MTKSFTCPDCGHQWEDEDDAIGRLCPECGATAIRATTTEPVDEGIGYIASRKELHEQANPDCKECKTEKTEKGNVRIVLKLVISLLD